MMQRRKHMMSREKFISVLFRQQQSGLSIADFCENEGYSRSMMDSIVIMMQLIMKNSYHALYKVVK